jgi:hypothetical protein
MPFIARTKVWFFWIATLAGGLALGAWRLKIFRPAEFLIGFLEGFTASMAVCAVIATISHLRGARTRS